MAGGLSASCRHGGRFSPASPSCLRGSFQVLALHERLAKLADLQEPDEQRRELCGHTQDIQQLKSKQGGRGVCCGCQERLLTPRLQMVTSGLA